MWIPKEIDRLSTRLKEGRRIHRITVRDLLRMFKAERRGLNKVHDIRTALDSLSLVTEPDFESVWVDALAQSRLRDPEVACKVRVGLFFQHVGLDRDALCSGEARERGKQRF